MTYLAHFLSDITIILMLIGFIPDTDQEMEKQKYLFTAGALSTLVMISDATLVLLVRISQELTKMEHLPGVVLQSRKLSTKLCPSRSL